MSKIPKRTRDAHFMVMGDHQEFLQRITKTLYYGRLPSTDQLSLPVTELAAEIFSEAQRGRSLDRLHCNDAAKISRNACVSPCSFVLAVLYLEQLKVCNPSYLQRTSPSELFLVALMVSSKFLHDDGEEDEVFVDEWANSGGISVREMIQLEKEFLNAIDWEIYVPQKRFWAKLRELEMTLAKKEGTNRGWFTYTELETLLKSINIIQLIQCVVAIISVLLTTYTLGLVTLIASVHITSNIPGNCLQNSLPFENQTTSISESESVNVVTETPTQKGCLNAADVLQTGILLASIKSTTQYNNNDSEATDAWAWWTNPAMEWLTRISTIEECDFVPEAQPVIYQFTDTSFNNYKMINLQDQIHKATKLRLQEQMERSWHKEWTDTFKSLIFQKNLLRYYF